MKTKQYPGKIIVKISKELENDICDLSKLTQITKSDIVRNFLKPISEVLINLKNSNQKSVVITIQNQIHFQTNNNVRGS